MLIKVHIQTIYNNIKFQQHTHCNLKLSDYMPWDRKEKPSTLFADPPPYISLAAAISTALDGDITE